MGINVSMLEQIIDCIQVKHVIRSLVNRAGEIGINIILVCRDLDIRAVGGKQTVTFVGDVVICQTRKKVKKGGKCLF